MRGGCGKCKVDYLFVQVISVKPPLTTSHKLRISQVKQKFVLSLLLGETDFKRMFMNNVAGNYNC